MRLAALVAPLLVAGCVTTVSAPPAKTIPVAARPPVSGQLAARDFAAVVARVEPVAERECAARMPRGNCDFRIVVDGRAGLEPNASQSLDPTGRPVITFTRSLILDMRNPHELAFVMSHEAAHHILGHIPKQQSTAALGALVVGALVSAGGASETGVRQAERIGAVVGARAFSKDMELEADALGTVITHRAGYDPKIGARYFERIPDPGDSFLGTHPPNSKREATVARVADSL